METPVNDYLDDNFVSLPEKPQFLKILCILSFVCCGLMILIYSMGLMCFFLSEETINTMWEKILERLPQLENMDRYEFFHAVGVSCIYNLTGNIISLIGVIMMWRLNKFGLVIYAIAEISVNFFGMDIKTGNEASSQGGLIFAILIDLIFIIMYAMNLKYMTKRNEPNLAP